MTQSNPSLESTPHAVARASLAACSSERDTAIVTLRPKYGDANVRAPLRYLLHGAPGAPVVIALGGISASRDVCTTPEAAGWWQELIGPGGAVDTERFRVLGIDWLDLAALDGAQAVSSEDQADALAALLDTLGIARVHALVGASYGAMVGLAFAARHAARIGHLVAISGAHRAHPMATALRCVQREIVRNGLRSGAVADALGLARQLAMTSYRGADEFAARFREAPQWRAGRFHFPVEDYLQEAGRRFVARFDANRFLELSESIDLHALDPATVRVPTTIVAVRSDRLVPSADLRDLAGALGAPANLIELDSPYGHDAFLKEAHGIGAIVHAALQS